MYYLKLCLYTAYVDMLIHAGVLFRMKCQVYVPTTDDYMSL